MSRGLSRDKARDMARDSLSFEQHTTVYCNSIVVIMSKIKQYTEMSQRILYDNCKANIGIIDSRPTSLWPI